jgi:hypothetical protein
MVCGTVLSTTHRTALPPAGATADDHPETNVHDVPGLLVSPRARIALFQGTVLFPSSPNRDRWDAHERLVLASVPREPRTALPGNNSTGNNSNSAWNNSTWIVWRLLSGNNRELARGIGVHSSSASARAEAQRTIDHVDKLEALTVFAGNHGEHAWVLHLEGEPMLISPRWHRSRRTNRDNLGVAVAAIGNARLSSTVTLLAR